MNPLSDVAIRAPPQVQPVGVGETIDVTIGRRQLTERHDVARPTTTNTAVVRRRLRASSRSRCRSYCSRRKGGPTPLVGPPELEDYSTQPTSPSSGCHPRAGEYLRA